MKYLTDTDDDNRHDLADMLDSVCESAQDILASRCKAQGTDFDETMQTASDLYHELCTTLHETDTLIAFSVVSQILEQIVSTVNDEMGGAMKITRVNESEGTGSHLH